MHVQLSFLVPKRVPTWVFAETPQRTNQPHPCSRTQELKKIVTKWPTGGRFLWTMSPYPPVTSPQDLNLPPGNSRPGDCPL